MQAKASNTSKSSRLDPPLWQNYGSLCSILRLSDDCISSLSAAWSPDWVFQGNKNLFHSVKDVWEGWKTQRGGREGGIKRTGERAGSCICQCLSYSAHRCRTVHSVTMVSAETHRCLLLGHREGGCKEKCVGTRERGKASIKETVQRVKRSEKDRDT